MGYTSCLTFQGLLGLESSHRSRSKEGWALRRISFVQKRMAAAAEEAITISSDSTGLIPRKGVGEAIPTVGEEASFTGAEHRLVVATGWGEREWGVSAYEVSGR